MATELSLTTADGVRLDACWQAPRAGADPGASSATGPRLAIVLAHGFTGSWRRPAMTQVAEVLRGYGHVLSFDFRGHGRSSGRSTVGDREVLDLDAAVRHARAAGHDRIATVGFSMGGSVVIRHAGLCAGSDPSSGVDAAVSVSGPGRWYYRGTAPMRRAHWVIERPAGRVVARLARRTRISARRWDPVPVSPAVAAAQVTPTPLLIVHGDRDPYFPLDHAQDLYAAAGEPKELWIEPGYGHAEAAATPALVHRIGRWVARRAAVPDRR